MAFLTDRKIASGLGSAKTGTEHHWSMTVTSVALIILVPFFLFTFGPMLGAEYAEVTAYFERPFPALIAILTIAVSFYHFAHGIRAVIEDYSDGLTRKLLIILTTCISYGAAAAGIFAVLRMAL